MKRNSESLIKIYLVISILFIFSAKDTNAAILWNYDAEIDFTEGEGNELYMMENCHMDTCSKLKAFEAISNPEQIPILRDDYALNDKCYRVFFPGCQNDYSENFCKKVMSEPMRKDGIRYQPQFPFGTDVWIAFSVFIPDGFYHPESGSRIIYQFHDHPELIGVCDEWRSPPLAIRMAYNKWVINIRYTSYECVHDDGYQEGNVWEPIAPIKEGCWTHFVLKVRFDYESDGLCQVWMKDPSYPAGTQLLNYHGPMGYKDKDAPYNYVSFGYYCEPWPEDKDLTLYLDRLLYGDENETFEKMMYQGESNYKKNGISSCIINLLLD